MSELTLTARIESRNDRHAIIGVFQNGAKAGTLTVEAEHAELVVKTIQPDRATPEELQRGRDEYQTDEIAIDDNAVVQRDDDGQAAHIQAWCWMWPTHD